MKKTMTYQPRNLVSRTKFALMGAVLAMAWGHVQAMDVVHRWCPPETPVQTEVIQLSADALFHFAHSDIRHMLPKGKAELDQLAQKLSSVYARVDSIKIVGHTDRIGSEKANYALGLRRAETVKAYLSAQGVTAPMQTDSAGESQPVTTNCQDKGVTAALKACLQPDRRVTVEITGVKK
ncbi:OmpA family protein [Pelistega europaea]|nr:OmpA family protein [Pelistega europaea]